MTHVAVIDTNVVAAGLMTAQQDAPTTRILDGMLTAAFPFALSEALLAEYREVLNRPTLRKRHGLTRNEIESLLVALAEHAIVLESVDGPAAPDPGDQHLWNLLADHDDVCLVTGDRVLLESRNAPAPVLTPAAFAAQVFADP